MEDVYRREKSRRVLVADPQPIFRLGLLALLEAGFPDWDIVGADALSAHRPHLQDGLFDLLIIDSRLLGLEVANGQPAGGLQSWGDIVAVTEPGDAIGVPGCLGAGAHATVCRSDPASRTLATIEVLAMRHRRPAAAPTQAAPPLESPEILNLTARQFDVLRLLAKGQSNKVIARDLGLSVSTVKAHLNTVFRALGAHNRVEAVVRARPFQAHMSPDDG